MKTKYKHFKNIVHVYACVLLLSTGNEINTVFSRSAIRKLLGYIYIYKRVDGKRGIDKKLAHNLLKLQLVNVI